MMDPEPHRTLDTSGTFCPVPIIETAKLLKTLDRGAIVLVIATDPGIQTDMPAWCKATRNELLALRKDGDLFRALVRKASG